MHVKKQTWCTMKCIINDTYFIKLAGMLYYLAALHGKWKVLSSRATLIHAKLDKVMEQHWRQRRAKITKNRSVQVFLMSHSLKLSRPADVNCRKWLLFLLLLLADPQHLRVRLNSNQTICIPAGLLKRFIDYIKRSKCLRKSHKLLETLAKETRRF